MQEAYRKRKSGDTSYRKTLKIPPDVYLIAEFGYYYGWGAVEAAKRGYVEGFRIERDKSGRITRIPTKIELTLEEVNLFVEAARKVWYSKNVDLARGSQVATASALSKHPNTVFDQGMKKFKEGARP